MTTIHHVGYVRADPLETAYRTIDELSAALRRLWPFVHLQHYDRDRIRWPLDEDLCTHPDCTMIGKALKA